MGTTLTLGRFLLGSVAIITSIGGFIADWDHTHVYNPKWPPHAKFHNGQTMSTGLLLGLSALYHLIRPIANKKDSLHFVILLLSLNWVAQLSAAVYPGALPVDPEFGKGFPQLYICAVLFSMIGIGYYLERSRIIKASHQIHSKAT
ncbi:hypothetical protein HBI56_238380 [Parastagonospora nodorum]|uniref:Acetyltransferase n=2 Tax=Phaeosphaeria nodorum (strain SN15 / ATCC MYA-4574 / FGSC 10173) TaxID=321614 RepID=A0A7U2FHJ6_PHANO|nr:hypothetical protein SNOG_09927 [Parastagonospora nodorum SN15]KAH3912821.1 hypothetical protein HBH56_108000 [Parastagonospora nodorum]EAT82262.1 hypothetical protein SNOG_09927 [Parastagonospora nodorum SN15]KAH3922257.1 hypothetical protein HBH54_225100 [Parastagonospora nodorum]KAH3974150.1 hypothetical protein HBH51_094460 [Parastagonospora nodorum]KAH3979444.1 hypothetical protein HBH52_103110 [Parastagonospora nodorum]